MTLANNQPSPIHLGYTVKEALCPPDGIAPHVTLIASVSECIARRPSNWIDRWDFNNAGLYNTSSDAVTAAKAVLNVEPLHSPWAVFAYSFYPIRFDRHGGAVEIDLESVFGEMPSVELEPGFQFLGFDVVERWSEPEAGKANATAAFGGFGCSPLSCNSMAPAFRVNRFCLIDEWNDAVSCARAIAIEQPEPGCYYLFGVYQRA